VITVALSLALQDILKNIVAGVYLLIERPFVIGDYIAVDTYTGTIEDILIRVTRLRTTDGQLILIPNATLFTSPVVNKSYYERRRVSLAVTLPENGADGVAAAQDHILAVLEAVPGVRDEPAPEVMLRGSSAGTLELRAAFWVPTGDPRREAAIVSDAIDELRHRLPDAQIAPLGGRPLTA
jgi:small-conductance mechanosensitive channel